MCCVVSLTLGSKTPSNSEKHTFSKWHAPCGLRQPWNVGAGKLAAVEAMADMPIKGSVPTAGEVSALEALSAKWALRPGAAVTLTLPREVGALAVAASGAMRYEGIAANDAHRDWLDSIVDRCIMYKAGHVEGHAEQLGGDAWFVEKASEFFGGTMMEARRLLMPEVAEGDGVTHNYGN